MRQIDSFFCQQSDQALFHYTGVSSLLGMAKSNSLWASNVYCLNDSKEIIHACDVLKTILRARLLESAAGPETEFLQQVETWIDHCKFGIFNLFVFSLSTESSLLSQWRSYTPHGKGVSLGLSPNSLNAIASKNNLKIAQCLYERHEHQELLESLLEKLLTTFRQRVHTIDTSQAHPSEKYHPFLESFRGDVLQVLSIIKHHAFKEEREWRLISPYYPKYTVPDIKFREGGSMLVPYIELNFGESKPVFSRVILGPSPHQNLSMSTLGMFLSNQKLCNMVENSQLPYREW
jgi:hypothetical protein